MENTEMRLTSVMHPENFRLFRQHSLALKRRNNEDGVKISSNLREQLKFVFDFVKEKPEVLFIFDYSPGERKILTNKLQKFGYADVQAIMLEDIIDKNSDLLSSEEFTIFSELPIQSITVKVYIAELEYFVWCTIIDEDFDNFMVNFSGDDSLEFADWLNIEENQIKITNFVRDQYHNS